MLLHANKIVLLIVLSCLIVTDSFASIVINGTRVIYESNKKEVTVTLTNNNKTPVLIQNWIEPIDKDGESANMALPFILTPPINRVDPGKGQTLRLSSLDSPKLPTNKESAFWLNVLEIPAKIKNQPEDQSRLNIAFRSRIKLFYRPEGLVGDPLQAPQQLRWVSERGSVVATNPTPYYITVSTVYYKSESKHYEALGVMIAPGASQKFKFDQLEKIINLRDIAYSAINDYGGLQLYKANQK